MASRVALAKAITVPRPRVGRVAQDTSDRRSRSSTPQSESRAPAKTIKKCPNPDCDGTETTEDGGQVICTECGAVVSDKQLTQDVQFGEAANGQAIVQGVHVGEGQETARLAPGSSRVMGGTASKEMAISDARRELTRLAANPGWGIRQSDVEKAERVFKLAYNYGHTKGRDRIHICAVCLYIAVRQRPDDEPTLMLIDFADFVKISVFYLGRLYTELCQEIRIHHEATVYQIRPELLAHRFCEELGFGEDTFRIATEAINIVKRMNRDWLVRGRRPSGIVGAAVILSARMNNYRRTVRELVYTAKVCEYTITKRLDEFRCTPISKLTVNEVRGKGWDGVAPEAVGPPALYPEAFKVNKKKRKKKTRGTERGIAAEGEDQSEGRDAVQSASADGNSNPPSPKAADGSQGAETGRAKKRKRATGRQTNAKTQAEIDRQAMPPPAVGELNIDPALLQASSQALQDIGDRENAEKLTANRRRGEAREVGDDADVEESGQQRMRRKRQPRPLPEPSQETLDDEEQLEADMNAHLRDAEMLAQTGPAHEEASEASVPPEMSETVDTSANDENDITTSQEKDVESDFLRQYFGIFHPRRPDDNDEDESYQDDDLPPNEQWTSQNHEDIHNAYKETVKHSRELLAKYPVTTAELLAKIPSSEIIPDSEFADDDDVNDMIMTEEDVSIKEALWISKYGKHLKERHLKRVQRLIDEENGNLRQPRKRGLKKPKPGDDSGYARDANGKVGKNWREAIKATFEHRGSNKLNYQAIGKILDDDLPTPGSGNLSQAQSTTPSRAGSVTSSRQSTPSSRVVKPVRMPRIPRDGKVPANLAIAHSRTGAAVGGGGGKAGEKGKSAPKPSSQDQEHDKDEEVDEEEEDEQNDYVGGARNEDDDEDDEDEEDEEPMPDFSNMSEAVRNRIMAGMSYEDAVAFDTDMGF